MYGFRIREKFIIWSEYYNHFDIYQPPRVTLLKPRQNNLSNPGGYSGLGQASKVKCLAEVINS